MSVHWGESKRYFLQKGVASFCCFSYFAPPFHYLLSTCQAGCNFNTSLFFLGQSMGCTHIAKRKVSSWPGWCTLETVWLQDQVSCSCSHLVRRLSARADRIRKFSLCFSHFLWLVLHLNYTGFHYFCIVLIESSMEPHCLSSAMTGCQYTPYGPLCMLCDANTLSTTIWLQKRNTGWPHFLINAVKTHDYKWLSTNDIILQT